ncbi:MAG TPA: NAD+ synthase [Microthrixaceae bacterium]|nr:NAD+ synthase [Microthrixaceae bacterium]
MRVALCQLDPTVGALDENTAAIVDAYRRSESGADVAVFGELAVCGYPPEDLVLKRRFLEDCRDRLDQIAAISGECAAVVGFPELGDDGHRYNAAALCRDGRVEHVQRKLALPTYDVFDEDRWFEPGPPDQALVEIAGRRVGLSICEDIWSETGPTLAQALAGAELLININGSPFHRGRLAEREAMLVERALETRVPVVYVNQVGGQDDLIFDGASMLVASDGEVRARLPQFVVGHRIVDTDAPPADETAGSGRVAALLDPPREVWSALTLGVRDYVTKNGFGDVVVGLSGGVDSSLVAAIAADALGAERVHGVLMPSRFSSDHSVTDAERLCEQLGIERRTIAIEPAHSAFLEMLAPSFGEQPPDLTEENLQSRVRGVTLMALSNKFGWLVLTTGNKSESAVGYSTLYGDTAGGLAVIKDVYKLFVYELCWWRNETAGREIVPESVLNKPPSAELRPDQRDDQSLPPYEVLDPILEAYIDGDRTEAELIEAGFDDAVVRRICRLVDLAEYKRRQSPPGLRVMRKAFGRDRRLPITNRYR